MGLQQGLHHHTARSGENFPVASRFLPVHARGPILAFYDFARGADNIADHPDMESQEKLDALNALEDAINKRYLTALPPWARDYASLLSTGLLSPLHGRDLLAAFKQDAEKNRYVSWQELLDYCQHSAAPVGRAVLELCGETNIDLKKTDALCNVLQIINHLQDIKKDYAQLKRIYIPHDMMSEHNVAEDDLASSEATDEKIALIRNMITHCQELHINAFDCWGEIRSFRLRLEIAWIWYIAKHLLSELYAHAHHTEQVRMTKKSSFVCLLKALKVAL